MDDYARRFGHDNAYPIRYTVVDSKGNTQGSVEFVEHDQAVCKLPGKRAAAL